MKLYNSLTKRKEEFIPLQPGCISMYVCGVTVYDVCHIGHARAAYVFDMMRRYFQYKGYQILFVRNITDVDDKIIQKARQEYPDAIMKGTKEIAERYYTLYQKDMEALGIQEADLEPKATGHISDMIRMIEKLIAKGYAYEANGDVYFQVRAYKKYGTLSGQSVDEMNAGVRKEVEVNKKDPIDFALWKRVKPEEPSWDSPWGKGRPGWHIECSAMSTKYLGDTFDIHAGGRDLIFPHHENEIAQGCAATGGGFARYWLHNGLLTIRGEKMAKSLGNFFTIQDILNQCEKKDADVLKIFFLQSHYASPVDYTEDKLKEAALVKKRFENMFARVKSLEIDPAQQETLRFFLEESLGAREQFAQAMDDDFNTPVALTVLFDLLNKLNSALGSSVRMAHVDYLKITYAAHTLRELGSVLGLFQDKVTGVHQTDTEEEILKSVIIKARHHARVKKDFVLADEIKQDAAQAGYVFEDFKDKTIMKKK